MPDWIHSVLYLLIMAGSLLFFVYLTGSLWGLVIGVVIGHVTAGAVVSRLPGFWDSR